MSKNLFKKAFNIHEGELRIALLMQLYIFLVITVLLMVKPSVSALFLSHLGSENLPYAYLLVAVVAVLSSVMYNWLVARFSIKIVAVATVLIFSLSFLLLSYVIYAGIFDSWILYFYYLSISLFGVLVTSQFWVIANLVFDLREAKRLFGFIGAGAIAGGIFGGYLTTLLADYFGNTVVILTATVFLLLILPLIFWIWHLRIKQLNKYIKADRKAAKHQKLGSAFTSILKSKHLLNLAAIVGVSVLVAKLVDYQFSDFSHRVYTNSDELASFFGFWFSSFNIISLLIQLFLTNRLLERFGVSTNMIFLPFALAAGSIVFMLVPELWVLILLKGVDTSFKQSINKAAFELSILPISYEVKKQAKPFIDVVVDSIATGIAGILLLLVIKKMEVGTNVITMLTLFFLFIWFILIYSLRKTYFDAFRTNIRKRVSGSDAEEEAPSKGDLIKKIFKEGSDAELVVLLKHFEPALVDAYYKQIAQLIDHDSDRVKAAAIHALYGQKAKMLKPKIMSLIEQSTDDEVVYEAMEYVLSQRSTDQDEIFEKYLDHEKDYIKNAALLCLSRASRYNNDLGKTYNLDKRIKDQIEEFTEFEDEQRKEEIAALLLSIGYSGREAYYPFIEKHLDGKDPLLVRYAIKAAGLTRYEAFIEKLIYLMGVKAYQEDIVNAMKRYGDAVVTKLYQFDQDEMIDTDVRGEIPKIIEKFKSKRALVVLLNLLESKDVLLRKSASESLKKVKDAKQNIRVNDKRLNELMFNECLYFKDTLTAVYSLKEQKNAKKESEDGVTARVILIGHLQRQLDHSLETIFNLLALKYAESDMRVALDGIKDNDDESRINAVEFLSNLLDSDLKDELLPLLEYHFLEDREVNLNFELKEEPELFVLMVKRRGVVSKRLILKLLLTYDDVSQYKPVIKILARHKNPEIKRRAQELLDR